MNEDDYALSYERALHDEIDQLKAERDAARVAHFELRTELEALAEMWSGRDNSQAPEPDLFTGQFVAGMDLAESRCLQELREVLERGL